MSDSDPFGWVGNTIADKYAIAEVAGAGAFGVVYRGTHLGMEVPIAVKCLKIAAVLPEADRRSVLAEARVLYQLSKRTPHVVQAIDVGAAESPTGDWTPYIVME